MSQGDRPILRTVTMGVGIATIVVGVMFLTVPAIAVMGKEWLIATLLMAGAVMTMGFAATALRSDVRIYTSLLSIVSLVTGVTILVHPLDTFITLTTLLGIYFTIESGLMGGMGMSVREHRPVSMALLFVAAISALMSALIWIRLAGASKSVILALLGLTFIARGMAYMVIASMMKGQAPLPPSGPTQGKEKEPAAKQEAAAGNV